jgi:hypothetical protein
MPTTVNEYVQTAQEQTLKSIRESQQAVVEAVKTWAAAVEGSVPEIPANPYLDELPTPTEIVQTSFEFAEQLLKAQRDFAESVLAAAAPVFTATTSTKKKTAAAA